MVTAVAAPREGGIWRPAPAASASSSVALIERLIYALGPDAEAVFEGERVEGHHGAPPGKPSERQPAQQGSSRIVTTPLKGTLVWASRLLRWWHGVLEVALSPSGRISRLSETSSGATGFESDAGKLTTYMTGVKTLGQKMEESTRSHEAEDRDGGLTLG